MPARAVAALLAVLLAAVLAACGASSAGGSVTAMGGTTPGASAALAPSAPLTGLPTVAVADLPPEAVTALQRIVSGGPYPYAKDGVVFANRERLLPTRGSDFYHEYTVVTPGSADRGARRIITGADGSRFYTDDHYASFREVVA